MDTSEKSYNLQNLTKNTGINAREAIEKHGSRRAYFKELSEFEDNIHKLVKKLTEKKERKDLLIDLDSLRGQLLKINDAPLAASVAEVMETARENADEKDLREQLLGVQKNILSLCQKINEADFSYKETQTPGIHAPKLGESAVKPDRAKMKIHSTLFSNLLSLIDKFEYDLAIQEATALTTYSYDDNIDNMLEDIAASLNIFDDAKASAVARRLLQYAVAQEGKTGVSKEKKKVLAVDDMPDVLSTVKMMLKEDFQVYCVNSYLAALRFLAENTADIILLDIEMPDMDGFELLKIIRQMDACKNTPVIYLTGNASVENIKTSVKYGGDDFIRKPVAYDVLIGKISKHLNKK